MVILCELNKIVCSTDSNTIKTVASAFKRYLCAYAFKKAGRRLRFLFIILIFFFFFYLLHQLFFFKKMLWSFLWHLSNCSRNLCKCPSSTVTNYVHSLAISCKIICKWIPKIKFLSLSLSFFLCNDMMSLYIQSWVNISGHFLIWTVLYVVVYFSVLLKLPCDVQIAYASQYITITPI